MEGNKHLIRGKTVQEIAKLYLLHFPAFSPAHISDGAMNEMNGFVIRLRSVSRKFSIETLMDDIKLVVLDLCSFITEIFTSSRFWHSCAMGITQRDV